MRHSQTKVNRGTTGLSLAKPGRKAVLLWAACAAAAGLFHNPLPAQAVHPGQWVHNSEADFTAGKTENAVVTNLGDVKLAASSSTLSEMPAEATIIYDLQATSTGDIYIAAGPEGRLLQRQGDKVTELLKLDNEQIFTLDLTPQGQIIVGISGETSRLAVLEKDNTLRTLVDLPDTRYVWDLKLRGQIAYVATGTEGKLLKVDLSASDKPVITELLATKQSNLLCLALGKDGQIYVGSDTDGLVYRVTENTDGPASAYVLYDADEPEIGALWVSEDGTLYVGTSDADQARPGRLEAASQGGQGRPAVEEAPAQSPTQQPDAPAEPPKPGDLPDVAPQPKPIEPPAEARPDAPKDKEPQPQAPAQVNGEVADPMIQQLRQHQAQALQAGASTDAPQPTPAQRDELRQVIRQRLEEARRTGSLQAGPGGQRIARRPAGSSPSGGPRPMGGSGAAKQGNAVYRISADGFVSEVFRESVMILNIAGLPDGSLLIATGNEGRLFRVNPASGETTRLLKLEPQQITAILPGPDGDMMLATANPATLSLVSPSVAQEGTFTSVVMDASQISLFGQMNIVADIPAGATVTVQTRSGNLNDPEKGPWSAWSEPQVLTHDPDADPLTPRRVKVTSPPARFLQYQLTLKATEGQSPSVAQVSASFVVPNLRPAVTSVAVNVPGTPPQAQGGAGNPSQPRPIGNRPAQGPSGPGARGMTAAAAQAGAPQTMEITWEATDPNNDQLTYTLEYRPANASVWLPLAKDLQENRYEWQTRRVPDGRYIVRVTASDHADNTPDATLTHSRASDPVLIDNTPPVIENLKAQPGRGLVTITGQARDGLSVIRNMQYVVDSAEQWNYILPQDLIYDSTEESFTVKISDLAPGQHVITLRAEDARGNATFEALIVEVK